ncbi:MAG: acyl-CoA dehydrogenase family protein [Candidatus Binatia bacterium]|nr:acyl-CoA dehydrogenase family protein [Candidatus Binatia bacterium]
MFEFGLEAEEQLIRDIAHQFARDVLRPSARGHERKGLPQEVFSQYLDLGFADMELPESLGGGGRGLFSKVVALEEFAWGDPGSTLTLENLAWLLPMFDGLPRRDVERIVARFREQPETRVCCVDGRPLAIEERGGTISATVPYCPASHHTCSFAPRTGFLFLVLISFMSRLPKPPESKLLGLLP